jgi:hypothetical protein
MNEFATKVEVWQMIETALTRERVLWDGMYQKAEEQQLRLHAENCKKSEEQNRKLDIIIEKQAEERGAKSERTKNSRIWMAIAAAAGSGLITLIVHYIEQLLRHNP